MVLDSDIFFLIFSDKEGFMCCKYHCNTHSDQWVALNEIVDIFFLCFSEFNALR